MVLSVMVVPLGAAGQETDPLPNDEVFEASDSVNVWERAVFPLRVDSDGAAETVRNPDLRAQGTGIGETSLAKDRTVVFNEDSEITLSYDALRAGSGDLDNTDVQVVAARITASNEGVPNTFSDAIDLISQEDANENATYEFVTEDG